MNRRGFLTYLGLGAPLAFSLEKAFQEPSQRYRPAKIISVSSTAYAIPITDTLKYKSDEPGGTKREWGRALRSAPHRPEGIWEYVVVKIVSDSGITGFGEATPDIGFFGETLEEVKSAIDLYLGPKLIGRNPFDREEILRHLDYRGNSCARSALDLALHDLMGKILNVPVYDLIGGLCRDKIPVALEISGGSPADMAAACAKFVQQGVRAFKPKIGAYPDRDAERLRAIRETVGPDVSIRADANQGYTVEESLRFVEDTRAASLELLEQPTPQGETDLLGHVTRQVQIPVMADESLITLRDAFRLARRDLADMVNVKLMKVGGIAEAIRINAVARAGGLEVMVGCMDESALGIAAALQFALVGPNVAYADLDGHLDLIGDPFEGAVKLEAGTLTASEQPGLGVDVRD